MAGRQWRLARSLEQLRREIDAAAPQRSKASDGSIGDAAHRARPSDHNPDDRGVVHAIDVTDDDAHGADMAKIVRHITTVTHDSRVKYLIHNEMIYRSYPTTSTPAWAAAPYAGDNPHVKHLHVSVVSGALADDMRPWGAAEALHPTPKPRPKPKPKITRLLRDGTRGEDVKVVQRVVGVKVDGDYGPRTEAAVRSWQKRRGLSADGIVGPVTARRMGLAWVD